MKPIKLSVQLLFHSLMISLIYMKFTLDVKRATVNSVKLPAQPQRRSGTFEGMRIQWQWNSDDDDNNNKVESEIP